MMDYKVGDIVRIKKSLCIGYTRTGLCVRKPMKRYFGNTYKIRDIDTNGRTPRFVLESMKNPKIYYGVTQWWWDSTCFNRTGLKFM